MNRFNANRLAWFGCTTALSVSLLACAGGNPSSNDNQNDTDAKTVSFNRATLLNMNGVKGDAKKSAASIASNEGSLTIRPDNEKGDDEYTVNANGDELVFYGSDAVDPYIFNKLTYDGTPMMVNGKSQKGLAHEIGHESEAGYYDFGGLFLVYKSDDGQYSGVAISNYDEDWQKDYLIDRTDPKFQFNSNSWEWKDVEYGQIVVMDGEIAEHVLNTNGTITVDEFGNWNADLGNMELKGMIDGVKVSGDAIYNDGELVGVFEGFDSGMTLEFKGTGSPDLEYVVTGGAYAGGKADSDDFFVGAWGKDDLLTPMDDEESTEFEEDFWE